MRDLWLISDTHFFHENILSFRDSKTGNLVRPGFDSVTHMNECMVENWNSVVKDGDIVYHLGDLAFGDDGQLPALMAKLKGSKRLIAGNHDNVKRIARQGFFKKIQVWRMFPEYNLLFSHIPIHPSSLRRGPPGDENAQIMTNVIGHIHQNPAPRGPYQCVCVEQINYTPIHIEDVAKNARIYMETQFEKDLPFFQPGGISVP